MPKNPPKQNIYWIQLDKHAKKLLNGSQLAKMKKSIPVMSLP